jgi:hypothetical protein
MKSTKIGIAVAGIFALTLSAANAREAMVMQQPAYTGPAVEAAPSSEARFESLQKQVSIVNQMADKFQGEASTLFKNFDALEWRLAFGSRLFHQSEAALTSALSAADLSSANAKMASAIAAKHTGGLPTTVTLLDNPCRVVDTRFGGGGVLGPSFRFWYAANTPAVIAGQGGNASGCGTYPNAEFFLVYVTVVPPGAPLSGGANFLTLQHDATGPTTSTMNFYPGINIANFAAVACNGCGSAGTGGFNAYASGNTHVVIDLVGVGNPTAATFWASVDAAGVIQRCFGCTAAGTSHIATGQYELGFRQDITSCGYNATIGMPTTSSTKGEITLAQRAGNPNGLFFLTSDSAGASADKPFYVAVYCN